jgi:hypothetical protein
MSMNNAGNLHRHRIGGAVARDRSVRGIGRKGLTGIKGYGCHV